MSYQEGYDDAIKYAIEILEELLYEWEGEESVNTEDIKAVVTLLYRAKPN